MKGNIGMTVALVILSVVLGFYLGRRMPQDRGPDVGGAGAVSGGPDSSRKTDRFTPEGNEDRPQEDRPGGTQRQARSPQAGIRIIAGKLELSGTRDMNFDNLFDAYEAVRWMSADDVRVALEELNWTDTTQQTKSLLEMMLINRWAKLDGAATVAFGMEQTQPGLRSTAIRSGLKGWARENPKVAYAWFQENSDKLAGGMKGGYMEGMFLAAMARQDMSAAFTKLGELGASSRGQALQAIAGQMGKDPAKREEFLKKLEGYGDAEAGNKALERLVSTWAWQDPRGAVKFLENHEFDAELAGKMMNDVARSWANTEPAAALAWRLKGAESGERGSLIADAYGRWLGQDPEGAEQWLAKQPSNVRSDDLYTTASDRLMRFQDYERAVTYAGKIRNEEQRIERMKTLYGHWKKNDEERARAWLGNLHESTRDAISQE